MHRALLPIPSRFRTILQDKNRIPFHVRTPFFSLIVVPVCLCIALPAVLFAQVNTEKMRSSAGAEGFSGILNVNLRLQTGNVEVFDTGSGVRIEFNRPEYLAFFVTNIQYAARNSTPFINRGFTHIRYNYTLRPRVIWEVFGQYEFNEFTRLFNRTLAGSGGRFVLRKRERSALYVGSSYMLEHEHLDVASGSREDSKATSHRWSNYFVAQWRSPGGASVTNALYIQPRLGDFRDIRILGDMEIATSLTGRISLTVNIHVRYDSRPPSGVRKTDAEVYNGLRFSF